MNTPKLSESFLRKTLFFFGVENLAFFIDFYLDCSRLQSLGLIVLGFHLHLILIMKILSYIQTGYPPIQVELFNTIIKFKFIYLSPV